MVLATPKKCNIFYSWQTDLPNVTNRGFIQTALEVAAKSIRDDDSIQIEPVIDRDTSGVPGAPDIADTILTKIAKSQIFVADVSIINKDDLSRKTPNPNVLIELGYAIKTLGFDRILMVMNTSFGSPELLPFDLRMKRIIPYQMAEEESNRSSERKKLGSILEKAIRTILSDVEQQISRDEKKISLADQAIVAIANTQPNQPYLVREYMKLLINLLSDIAPQLSGEGEKKEPDEIFMDAIQKTADPFAEFSKLTATIAMLNSRDSALALFKAFEQILERYNLPNDFSGHFTPTQFDFYKFIGHELFVIFISFMIIENRWEIITDIVSDSIYVKNIKNGTPDTVTFEQISKHVTVLQYRKKRLNLNRMSIHADILEQRHTAEELGAICPMEQFIATDLFLFLRAGSTWTPWSTLYLYKYHPRFIVEATNKKYADQLLKPLNVENIDALRMLFKERFGKISDFYRSGFWHSGLENIDLNNIGIK